MAIYYSATTNSFYDSNIIKITQMPEDSKIVTDANYKALMDAQCDGHVITANSDGTPCAITQQCGPCSGLIHDLTIATANKLGHVKGGGNVSIDANGVMNANIDLSGYALDSNVVHTSGVEVINGIKIFTNDISCKNSNLDLTATPTSNTYATFNFTDKNNKILGFLQYSKQTSGNSHIGLYLYDSSQALHGIWVTANNEVIPIVNNTYSLGSPNNKWKNVYATTFNGNLKGNADTATKAKSADSVEWANVTGKPAYIAATWRSDTSWYRVWSDGWIEQGGRVQLKTGSNMADKINFPKAFSTNQYTAIISDQAYPETLNQGTSGDVAMWGTTSYTTTGMFVMSSAGSGRVANWYACGY